MKQSFSSVFVVAIAVLITITTVCAQVSVELEAGMAIPGYLDVRIPGNTGSDFSLTSEFDSPSVLFYRGTVQYDFDNRHSLILLIAPLTVTGEGRVGRDLLFQDKTFPRDAFINTTWKFNSYRLTYQYKIFQHDDFDFGLGLTAKIRDAKIALSAPGISAEKTDLGFVPLIHILLDWRFSYGLGVILEGDALAAPQGRAEDIFIGAHYRIGDLVRIKAGYRFLEGGADNDKVYNFSLIHYAALGVRVAF